MQCENCGNLIQEENAKFCPECGMKIQEKTGISGKLRNLNAGPEKEAWPKRLAVTLFFWGIVNLILTSPWGGGVLIFFAVLILASRSSLAIYAFGVIWLLIAFFQLMYGVTFYQATSSISTGFLYILISIVNFIFAGYSIYKTRIVNESVKQGEISV